MSWSLSLTKVRRDDARKTFQAAHEEQGAYRSDGPHKIVMDKIAAFAADVAETAPADAEVWVTSSGHINTDGTGSVSVYLSLAKAFPAETTITEPSTEDVRRSEA